MSTCAQSLFAHADYMYIIYISICLYRHIDTYMTSQEDLCILKITNLKKKLRWSNIFDPRIQGVDWYPMYTSDLSTYIQLIMDYNKIPIGR